MAETTKTYITLANLTKYDEKIKAKLATDIAAEDTAIKSLIGTIPAKVGETDTLSVISYVNAKFDELVGEDGSVSDQIKAVTGEPDEGKTLQDEIDAVEADIETLNADDQTEGSVSHTVATELAKIVNENNNGSVDTLNEIAAWIINDTTGAAKMANDIATLNGADTVAGSVAKSIKDKVESLDAEITSADGGDLEVKVTEVDGKITAVNVTNFVAATEDDIVALFAEETTEPNE